MMYMAGLPEGQRVGRSSIAAVTEVPEAYLAKILQLLVKARLIRSRPGVRGGFELSRTPSTLSMLEVIEAVDGPTAVTACVIDESACDRAPWCCVRDVLADAQKEMLTVLRAATIGKLASQCNNHQHVPVADGRALTSISSAS